MKIVTYNLRYQDDENGNSIDQRAPRLKQVLSAYDADVMGFQEVTPGWLLHLERDYGEAYEIFSRYRGGAGLEAVPILWKKARFVCVDRGTFWLSETPDEESAGYDETGCYRICMWVTLRERESGRVFTYFNTHFGFGKKEQAASVRLVLERMGKAEGPAVLTGDFNLNRQQEGYRMLTKYLVDVNAATDDDRRGSFHAYGQEGDGLENQIDFCFVTPDGLKPVSSRRMDELVEGRFVSDHYGVCSQVGWPGEKAEQNRCRPVGRCRFQGVTDRTIRFLQETQLTDESLWRRFAEQFRSEADAADGGWRGEYWGKMMRGACFVWSYTRDEALYGILESTVRDMMGNMGEEGRISTYGKDTEFTGWDMWNRKYVLLGMQYFLEICREAELARQITSCMCRQADYILEHIGSAQEGKKPVTKASDHWRGLNSSSILEPVVRLYNLTGEERYLAFAGEIVKAGGTSVANLFALAYEDKLCPYQYPMTKAYEMISCFEGLLEYWKVTQTPWHKEAVLRFAKKLLESDFTVIGSSGCTHELFDHSTVRQAGAPGGELMQETCVTVTLMKFFWELALLTGESVYVDAFERAYYNAYLGAVNTRGRVSPLLVELFPQAVQEAMPFDSYSPLTAGVRGKGIGGLKLMADGHTYGCCACIGAAGAGLVPKMALTESPEGLFVNLYLPGELEAGETGGRKVRFFVETEYPGEGRVRILTETQEKEPFVIGLREPGWSRETKVWVDGVPVYCGKETLSKAGEPCRAAGMSGDADGMPARAAEMPEAQPEGMLPKEAGEPCRMAGVLGQNQEALSVTRQRGYILLEGVWQGSHEIVLELDMGTEAVRPAAYGHDILMTRIVWEENYVVPVYDEETPEAKERVCLRRGPLVLAASDELGYDASGVFDIAVGEDGYVEAKETEHGTGSCDHMAELEIALRGGGSLRVMDYASAGKKWEESGKIAAWIRTGKVCKDFLSGQKAPAKKI